MTTDTRDQLAAELYALAAQAEALRFVHLGDFDIDLIPDYAQAMSASAKRASSLLEELVPSYRSTPISLPTGLNGGETGDKS